MKIAHLISNSNSSVLETYIKFINDNFNMENHTIYINKNNASLKVDLEEYKNINIIHDLKVENILDIVNKHNKLIIHFLNFKTSQMFKLLFNEDFFNKTYWVAWGADLYQWEKKCDGNILTKFKLKIKNKISYKFKQKIKCFVGIFPPDIEFFKKEFRSDAKTFYATYVGGLYNSVYKKEYKLETIEEKKYRNEYINIQIGHSSTKILNHIDVLKELSKFKDENIKIYIPLSYGDREYGDLIEKEAQSIFGKNAIILRDMMDKDSYFELLSTIDIAIYNTHRQIGLGNISPMLYMKKKIFIPKGTVMYDFYKSYDINICNYEEIKNMSFNEFSSSVSMENGKKYILENAMNKEKKIEMWEQVFNYSIKEDFK